jgi:hypothetical protein
MTMTPTAIKRIATTTTITTAMPESFPRYAAAKRVVAPPTARRNPAVKAT